MTEHQARILLVAVVGLSLAGCAAPGAPAAGAAGSSVRVSAALVSPQATMPEEPIPAPGLPHPDSMAAAPTAIVDSVLDELTPDDNLALNPPGPVDVRPGTVTATSVELLWDAPPPVSVPHTYSDRVVEYRVYRGVDDDLELTPLASTASLRFIDKTVRSGHTYRYAVTSIRERNVEGTKSDPVVTVTLP